MDCLQVELKADGCISVFNNGKGIPVAIHKDHNIYVPELIFGHLLTSSNFNDSQKKTTGGRNGYGAKLANIFSMKFRVETADAQRGLVYRQDFRSNMRHKDAPVIRNFQPGETVADWTRISFLPDYRRFHLRCLDADHIALLTKRVYDIAGTTPASLKVVLNGRVVGVNTFQDYVGLYFSDRETEISRVYKRINARWEVCVCRSEGNFQSVSFVNNIATTKGGTHVDLVIDQLTAKLLSACVAKNKDLKSASLKPSHVKNHLQVFINALIENPAFDSQTKVTLTSRKQNFGSTCEIDDKFVKNVIKHCGVLEQIALWASVKQSKELKRNDGKKQQRISGIPKLEDANEAGGRRASRCTLILTEGDSAKALAMSGLSVVGRDLFGVFPLKGKLLNVREASTAQILANTEISNLKKIIGLKQGKVYSDTSSLRYGHIMVMTDQDHDGSHIKGLIINMLHHFWPSLLLIPGFLTEFITPIVVAKRSSTTIQFYTIPEYELWKAGNGDGKGWNLKYYKGLGTSTAREAKQYFAQLARHKIDFIWSGSQDAESIQLAFDKRCADARKEWLAAHEDGSFLDQNVSAVSYHDFIHKELILFSLASNARAIPSVADGLKPGQRKVLFACFKRKLHSEIKVAQLAGYVSEQTAYHHGENSLTATIVGMAQTFLGSNNVNLLSPSGQFGTRAQGGRDAASSRYIFTGLTPMARALFPDMDDNVLEYLTDDGQSIEPKWYLPVLPLVLLNGANGIGTGWSTSIPSYNPKDLAQNVYSKLRGSTLHSNFQSIRIEVHSTSFS